MVAAKSMAIAKEKEIVLGETIKFTVSYDVLGHDVLDKTGIIAREPNSVGKYLVLSSEVFWMAQRSLVLGSDQI